MKFYAISGLGADSRVFAYLKLEHEILVIDWIEPKKMESIEEYSLRLSININTKEPFGLIGVSFGGLVAVELSKILKSSITILISSVALRSQLSLWMIAIGKSKILRVFPERIFKIPKFIAHYIFGAREKELLNSILDDTNLTFAKWALNELVTWKNESKLDNVIMICGADDRMLSPIKDDSVDIISGGGHFMIVDKADELSRLINMRITESNS